MRTRRTAHSFSTTARRRAVLACAPLLLAAGVQVMGTGTASAQPIPWLAPIEEALRHPVALPWAARPTAGFLTSGFGPRWGQFHAGLDIANYHGAPVFAAAPGVVVDAGPAAGFGLWVRVAHPDGTRTVYGHVDQVLAWPGQPVAAGQQIATVGSRGDSSGPHLHFEVHDALGRPTDPQWWLASRGLPMY